MSAKSFQEGTQHPPDRQPWTQQGHGEALQLWPRLDIDNDKAATPCATLPF